MTTNRNKKITVNSMVEAGFVTTIPESIRRIYPQLTAGAADVLEWNAPTDKGIPVRFKRARLLTDEVRAETAAIRASRKAKQGAGNPTKPEVI